MANLLKISQESTGKAPLKMKIKGQNSDNIPEKQSELINSNEKKRSLSESSKSNEAEHLGKKNKSDEKNKLNNSSSVNDENIKQIELDSNTEKGK